MAMRKLQESYLVAVSLPLHCMATTVDNRNVSICGRDQTY